MWDSGKICLVSFPIQKVTMAQSQWMLKSGGKLVEVAKPRLKISVLRFDNSEQIAQFAKTVIGRCMNPPKQEMKNPLYMLPRIWQVEGRVHGVDLGLGRFWFDFEWEEDIVEVLKMEPFHFDHWMVSLVRWKPVLEPNYPSKLMFWVRVIDVPMQFWAESTFRSVGDALGRVHGDVDLGEGRVRVELDGFKPLVFSMDVDFAEGVELVIHLRYEKLVGFCKTCFCMTHEQSKCPSLVKEAEDGGVVPVPSMEQGFQAMSYKGAVTQAKYAVEAHRDGGDVQDRVGRGGAKGKGSAWEMQGNHRREGVYRASQGRFYRGNGEGSSGGGRYYGNGAPREQNRRFAINPRGLQQANNGDENLSNPQKLMMDDFKGINQAPQDNQEGRNVWTGSGVKKSLQFEEPEKGVMVEEPTMVEMGGLGQERQNGLEDAGLGEDLDMRSDLELMLDDQHSALDDANLMMEGVLLSDSELLEEDWEEGELPDFTEETEAFPVESITAKDTTEEEHGGKANRKKGVKHGVFGGASKKRLVHSLLSPRKPKIPKGPPKNGEKGNGDGKKANNKP